MSLTDENSLVLSFNIGPIYVATSEIALKRSRDPLQPLQKLATYERFLKQLRAEFFHKSVAHI